MAITVEKVVNSGLKCGDIVVPTVKVVISGNGELTNEIMEYVYQRSTGFVTGAACMVNSYNNQQYVPDVLANSTTGNYTFGSDNGFKYSMSISRISYSRKVDRTNGTLSYNGRFLCSASFNTGYDTIEWSFLYIFVDSFNKLYYPTFMGTAVPFCRIGTNYDIGLAIAEQIFVAPIPAEFNKRNFNSIKCNLEVSEYDITSDIAYEIDPTDTDPYNPGGTSGEGGGTGDFDGTTDFIEEPGLPTLSAVDTGFITLYNPSLGQLKALADYMWSDLFSLDTFKKLFADPMDAILGLSIVPVNVPSGATREVTVGNIGTGVSMTLASSQYVRVDCGILNVNEYWGAYLDYDPYTKCYIYLPYIGTHPIATDDVMNKAVQVTYHIDILSGSCTAYIICDGTTMYEFIGQVSSQIPITGNNFANVIKGALDIAGSIGTMVATGGFSAPASVAKAGLAGAYTTGHFIGAGASMAQDVMSMKPQVEKSGAMSGTGGMLSIQTPYMILERPRQALPEGQNKFMGYPSFMTKQLSSLSGYTEVESIHLENVPCTELEAAEILKYLESGVIL